jgi:hypothetical protein
VSYYGETGPVLKKGLKKKADKNKKAMGEVKADKAEVTLWRRFSQFIRMRDCKIALTNPNNDNYEPAGMCISCGSLKFFRDLECGHFIPRRWKAVKYDERNNSGQCNHCNEKLRGNVSEYRKALVLKIGEGQVREIEDTHRDVTKKMDTATIKGLTAYYRERTIEEAERLGVEPPK